jgi:hypothetical protein
MRTPIIVSAAIVIASALAACGHVPASGRVSDRPGSTVVLAEQKFAFASVRQTISVAPDFAAAEAIAIRPLNGDAECTRVVANFADGGAMDLPLERDKPLTAGGTYWMALPARQQTLIGLEMFCRPVHPGAVDMQVLAAGEVLQRRG